MSLNPATRPAWLLRLYPTAWRARYGEEFAALLDDEPPTFFGLLDVLLGALDAHIAPVDTNGRILRMLHRPRRSAIIVFCAYIAFVLAGLSYNQSIEDDIRMLNSAHTNISLAYHVVYFAAPLSLLAVLAGGLPIGLAVALKALRERRRDLLLLFAVPPLALAAWLGWTLVILTVIAPANRGTTVHQPLGAAVFVSWGGLFVLAAIASTAAVSVAISRCELEPRGVRVALGPAAAATLLMAVMLAAVVAWGLFVRATVPAYLTQLSGPFGLTESVYWLVEVTVMAIATLVAAIALLRASRAQGDLAPSGAVALNGA
ncbi:MAG: hypothetical protein ACHQ4H_14000 [Ktedonobacterales bacterium]